MNRSGDGFGRLAGVVAAIEESVSAGTAPGAAVYCSVRGETVADLAVGEARPGVAFTPEHVVIWFSAGKPVTAAAVMRLCEAGAVGLDNAVARHVPEFAANGKAGITLRHLLTHTGGFRAVANVWTSAPWDAVIAQICNARPEPGWVPGRRAGYHAASSWFMLGEVVRRVSGRAVAAYVREELLLPMGLRDSWLAMPEEVHAAYGNRLAMMADTGAGAARQNDYDSATSAATPRPGSGMRGPVRELGRFYEALLSGGAGVLGRMTVEAMTARHRVGMFDESFKAVMDWGLGMICNSAYLVAPGGELPPYHFGPDASMRAYGHGGYQSSVAFADPETGVVFAVVFNGTPGEAAHHRRMNAVLSRLYPDLGLA